MQTGYEAHGTAGPVTTSTPVGDGWVRRLEPFFPAGARRYPYRLTVEPIEGEPHTLSPTQRLPSISTGRDGATALELGLACHASHLAEGPIALPLADRTLRVPNR